MKIILFGKDGQVGWELQRALQPLGEVLALGRTAISSTHRYLGDITNFNEIKTIFEIEKPDIIVNAAAYTAVDNAETEKVQCDLVNHLGIVNLSKLCKQFSCLLIHYSTDYVFDGSGNTSWLESDATNPINHYGSSKRLGEVAIEKSGCAFINLRTSWVYGIKGHNFIKTMLKLANTKEELSIVSDQIGAPTGADLIADVTAQVIRYYMLQSDSMQDMLTGHYHLAAGGETSWYDYAHYIFDTLLDLKYPLTVKAVKPVSTQHYPTPATRPLNSRLNTTKLQDTFKLSLPHWKLGVSHTLQELIANESP